MPNNTHILNKKIKHTTDEKPIKSSDKFSQQEVDLAETPLFFPAGFEKIFLMLYFISLPYIAGFYFFFLCIRRKCRTSFSLK